MAVLARDAKGPMPAPLDDLAVGMVEQQPHRAYIPCTSLALEGSARAAPVPAALLRSLMS